MFNHVGRKHLILEQTVGRGLRVHHPVDVDSGLGETFFHKKYPCVCIEIGFVLRFQPNGTVAHFLRLVELLALQRQKIGIIVEAGHIVILVHKRGVVASKSLLHPIVLVIQVA